MGLHITNSFHQHDDQSLSNRVVQCTETSKEVARKTASP
jgi:hypothetical protein